MLRRVEPTGEPGWFRRAYAAMAATRVARLVSRLVGWKLDPILLRLTGGRVASTLVFPTLVLETVGAKTGERRRNAVIYFHDGDSVVVVASFAGAPRHPAWFHNVVASPNVLVNDEPMRAEVVADDDERTRLWALADRVFPTFPVYRREASAAGRTIPIVRLAPAG